MAKETLGSKEKKKLPRKTNMARGGPSKANPLSKANARDFVSLATKNKEDAMVKESKMTASEINKLDRERYTEPNRQFSEGASVFAPTKEAIKASSNKRKVKDVPSKRPDYEPSKSKKKDIEEAYKNARKGR